MRTEPFWVSYCHCADCRKATGAPVTAFAGFSSSDITIKGGPAATYRSSSHVERLFCADCGTPIGYVDDRLRDEAYFYIGLFDEIAELKPTLHAWTSEQVEWLSILDELPRYYGFSRERG